MNTARRLHESTVSTLDLRSDDDLVLRATRGDRAAVGLLYQRRAGVLRAAASFVLGKGNPAVDDVVAEVFVLLLEAKTGAFEPARGCALPWLKGIVRRTAQAYAATESAIHAQIPHPRGRT